MVAHKRVYFSLSLFTWLSMISCLWFNFLSAWGRSLLDIGLFRNDTGAIYSEELDLSPSGKSLPMWATVYLWQVLWMIYGLSTMCRKSEKGYLYYSPPFLHWSVYVGYMFVLACNVAWLITWNRELPHIALGFLMAMSVTLNICIGISVRGIHKYFPDLVRCGHPNEARLVVGFVHNGLGVFTAWVTVAMLVNMVVVLHGVSGFSFDVAYSIGLGALSLKLVLYLLMDLVMAERYLRFLFTPYLVLIAALVNSLYVRKNMYHPNSVFHMALLSIAITGFLVKISVSIVRQRRKPIFVKTTEMYTVQMVMSESINKI